MANKPAASGVLLGWNELHKAVEGLTRRIDTLASTLGGAKTSGSLFAGITAQSPTALAQQALGSRARTTPPPPATVASNPLTGAGWGARWNLPYHQPMASSVLGNFSMPAAQRTPNGGMRSTVAPAAFMALAGRGMPVGNGGHSLGPAPGHGGAGGYGGGYGGTMLPPAGGASLRPPVGNGGHSPGTFSKAAPLAAAAAVGFAGRSMRALANYGDEKMVNMAALELAAASAALGQSGSSRVGRNMFISQAMGPNASQPSNTVAVSQADAINTVLARMRTSGSLGLSTQRDTAADRAWRSLGMVVGNASFSSTDAATAAAQIQSPQFQHRAAMLGLGSTFDAQSRSYIGNAALARRMLAVSTGSAAPTQERLMAGLQEGGKLRYMLGQTGWDAKTTEQFTGYLSQLVDLQQRGLDWKRVDSLLAQASDKSNPGYTQARQELKKFGWNETQLQIEKDTKALDRSADAAVFDDYIARLKESSKAVEDWTTFLKKFLDLPPVKALLGAGGAVAKFRENPGALLPWLGGTQSKGLPVPPTTPINPSTAGSNRAGITDLSGGLGSGIFGGGNTTHVPQAGPDDGKATPKPNKDTPKTTESKKRNQQAAGGGVSAAIRFAMAQLGEPYVWGGTGPNGWDCSGLMQGAYKAAGAHIRRTTFQQIHDGRPVSRDPKAWLPGDLIFPNSGHVVMWLGNGRYIHAPRRGDVVRIANKTPRAMAVRRILGGGGEWTNAKGTDPKAAEGTPTRKDNGFTGPQTRDAQQQPATDWASNSDTLGQRYDVISAAVAGLGMTEKEVLTQIFAGPPGDGGGDGAASPQSQARSDAVGSAMTTVQKVLDTVAPFTTDGKKSKDGKTPKAGRGGSPEANKRLGQAMASARGWQGVEWSSLLKLWMKESGWNHKAVNPSSGAAGIPQALPSAHPGVVTPEWMANPQAQIQWGLNYIAGRYKRPSRAWQHSQRTGWYRSGAWDVPEDEMATVHQGEMVIAAPQARKIREVLTESPSAPVGGGGTVNFTFGANSIVLHVGAGASAATARTSAQELFDELQRIARNTKIAKGD